jgi:hypothetical protein
MLELNEDAEECALCGEVPHRLCEECGCCAECCECDEEESDG